jgi:Uma2 family endonuclease
LSPSTEDYDRGEKLDHYRQIGSLEEVVLVHHDERKIVVWRRTGAELASDRVRRRSHPRLLSAASSRSLRSIPRPG